MSRQTPQARTQAQIPAQSPAPTPAPAAGQYVAAGVYEALATRRSVRGFRPDPVPRDALRRILEASARAPSGTNMQPWLVHVVEGETRTRLVERVLDAHYHHEGEYANAYRYYPDRFFEPYLARRRQVGWALYGLAGIQKGETEKMKHQHARNYRFFDAPVGLMFTIHRDLELGSWLDYGMFIENVMLAARAEGLHTCPQVAWARYHPIVREVLGLPEEEVVVCGMSVGYEDPTLPENALRTPRAPLEEWVTFHG